MGEVPLKMMMIYKQKPSNECEKGGYGGDDDIEEDEAKMGSFSKLMSMVLVLNYTKKTDKIRDLTSFTSSFPHVTSTSLLPSYIQI